MTFRSSKKMTSDGNNCKSKPLAVGRTLSRRLVLTSIAMLWTGGFLVCAPGRADMPTAQVLTWQLQMTTPTALSVQFSVSSGATYWNVEVKSLTGQSIAAYTNRFAPGGPGSPTLCLPSSFTLPSAGTEYVINVQQSDGSGNGQGSIYTTKVWSENTSQTPSYLQETQWDINPGRASITLGLGNRDTLPCTIAIKDSSGNVQSQTVYSNPVGASFTFLRSAEEYTWEVVDGTVVNPADPFPHPVVTTTQLQ